MRALVVFVGELWGQSLFFATTQNLVAMKIVKLILVKTEKVM